MYTLLHLFYLFVLINGRKCRGKRPLRNPRRRSVDNIKMDLGEIGWGGVDWIGLAQDRKRWRALANAVMSLSVP
jgi:hypothetical protein